MFLQDCPLSCVWCCNPETRFGSRYKEVTVEQLYGLIARDQVYFDATNGGITFSGGEPLFQTNFIVNFMIEYGHLFNCNIETSLFASYEAIEKVIPYMDEWYVDFKVYDEEQHMKFTKVSNDVIKRNLALLSSEVSAEKIITYPIITGLNDSVDNVEQMISYMKEHGLYRIKLHPYRKNCEKRMKDWD